MGESRKVFAPKDRFFNARYGWLRPAVDQRGFQMMTAAEREDLYKNFLAALDRVSMKTAAKQCLKDLASRDNPTTAPYERPLFFDLPKPQPTVHITINFGKE